MVQVQSTWFPLIDRNPQKFVPNIFEAKDGDFKAATQRIYRSAKYPSRGHNPGRGEDAVRLTAPSQTSASARRTTASPA